MQYTFVSGSPGRHTRLILIFAGWGMDSRPFEGLVRPGYDIAVIWDYRKSDFPESIVQNYSEIVLVAWSMGVFASLPVIPRLRGKLTLTLAVNGTPYPVDDTRGIPENIFNGTLEGFCKRTLEKFRMRMCGGAKAYNDFKCCEPLRPISELKEELSVLGNMASPKEEEIEMWDHSVIGKSDAIFPPENQAAAWAKHARSISHFSGPHMPRFQDLLDHFVRNKETVERRFERSTPSYVEHAVVQREIAEELMDLVRRHGVSGKHPSVLEVGSGTGLMSTPLAAYTAGLHGTLELWDLVDCRPLPGVAFRCADAETAIREVEDESYDLITSASTIQWFNSPTSFMKEAMRCLRPNGLLAVSTFVMGNVQEVAQATGIFLPLISEEDWAQIAAELGDVLELYSRRITLHFDTPVKVFRHLKDTGVNALSPKESLLRSLDRYPRDADGSCPLTYAPAFILIRKK